MRMPANTLVMVMFTGRSRCLPKIPAGLFAFDRTVYFRWLPLIARGFDGRIRFGLRSSNTSLIIVRWSISGGEEARHGCPAPNH